MYLFRRLKKKWFQTLILSVVFLMISTLVYIALSISSSSNMFDVMLERSNGSQALLLMNATEDNEDIKKEIEGYSTIESVHSTPLYMGELQNQSVDESVMISPYSNDILDKLYIDNGQFAHAPEINEIYINYNFARSTKLKIGDQVRVVLDDQNYSLVVSEIVVDPHFTSPFMTPKRVIVSSDFFVEHDIQANKHIYGIRFHNPEIAQDDTYEMLNEAYSEDGIMIVDYPSIRLSYRVIQGIISAVLMVVSVLIFVISMIVIRNIVHQSISQKYKEIGVMKVLGYTKNNIQKYFMDQYIIIGTVASVLGVFVGLPIRRIINNQLASELKVEIDSILDINMILTPIIVLCMILLSVYLITRKTRSIKPVQAIKYGTPESKVKKSRYNIGRSKMPLVSSLAYKQVLMGKRNVVIILTITLLMFASSTIYNIGKTMESSTHFASYLLGIDVGDFSININSLSEEDKKWLENIDGVETVNYYELLSGSVVKDENGTAINVSKLAVIGDESKVKIEEGRYPKTDNEVVISAMLSSLTGKIVGDYINIEADGEDKRYLITGIQNSVMNSSKTYISKTVSQSSSLLGFVWGYGDFEIDKLDQLVKERFGNEASVTRYDGNVKSVLSTVESFPTIIKIILIVLLTICSFVLVNLTIMEVSQDSKSYGIMKVIGFSNTKIQQVLVMKTLLATGIGSIIGLLLSFTSSDFVYQIVFKMTPFPTIKMPIIYDYLGSIIIMMFILVASYVSVWLPSLRIKKISPKQLIAE